MDLQTIIATGSTVAIIIVVTLIVGRVVGSRVNEQLQGLVQQLVPVVIVTSILMGTLIIIDPSQAGRLLDATFSFIPKAVVAVLIILITRSLGRIVGTIIETALRSSSPILARRAGFGLSMGILGVGLIIALEQLGVPTNIILILVAALAFGSALAGGLAVGLGSLSISRQVASGRYVQDRFKPGQLLRIEGIEGRVVNIGLSSTNLEGRDGTAYRVPNEVFLQGVVTVLPD